MEKPAPRPVVVCVDDERPVLSALERLLRGEPYELLTTESPAEALQWVKERAVEVLVADHRMPEMTGAALVQGVRACSPSTRCVLLTGFPDRDTIRERRSRRIERLITKPWSDDDLRSTIRRLAGDPAPGDVDRVDCSGRPIPDLLSRLLPRRRPARLAGARILIIDNLFLLEGSVARFLGELLRSSIESSARITLVDASGLAETFLTAIGGAEPYLVAKRKAP